jgi:hypothetical protein
MFATSPDRFGFMIENYKKRIEKDPDNVEIKKTMELYEEFKRVDALDTPDYSNLGYELRRSEKIVQKCKLSSKYSQNMYAALCNNLFVKDGAEWGCSWRAAGGLAAHLREQGDYVDFYCSGMADDLLVANGRVAEGVVTDEVREDIASLGWVVKSETP